MYKTLTQSMAEMNKEIDNFMNWFKDVMVRDFEHISMSEDDVIMAMKGYNMMKTYQEYMNIEARTLDSINNKLDILINKDNNKQE